ncbi:MAG: hypothetical protein ACE5HY_03915 [Candidatus Hydrothermarchaeales archaeon]
MTLNLAEMKEEELLGHWTNQAQTGLKILKRINGFAERARDILNASAEFYADSKEFMSPQEIRQYLKHVSQIKLLINNGDELLDNLEQFQRVYKMRSSR